MDLKRHQLRQALMALLLGLAGLAPGRAFAAGADAPAPEDAAKIAEQICASCHGPGGASTSPIYPVLAGQHEEYLAAQLRAFKERTRSDPEAHNYMWTMATLVNDSMIGVLSHYYAGQPTVPGSPGDAADVAAGKALFEKGIPARGTMACSNCHGQNAEGHWVFPRLAGQRSQYVFRQLQVIQGHLRKSPVMHGIVKDLKPEEMRQLGAYLQSLP
ncbi:MAG TPA: c-type cytochrome [Nevskia sp.]|jgi:cytochrome c553|nr:c-type cytochrome [Nevskia sp.]